MKKQYKIILGIIFLLVLTGGITAGFLSNISIGVDNETKDTLINSTKEYIDYDGTRCVKVSGARKRCFYYSDEADKINKTKQALIDSAYDINLLNNESGMIEIGRGEIDLTAKWKDNIK